MSVTSSDITHLQSADAGSTGGAISASGITSGVMNNVWSDISDSARIAGTIVYRKTFFKNNNVTDSLLKPTLYVYAEPTNATLLIGLGTNNASDNDALQGNMTAWSANARVSVSSSALGDTRVVTVYGVDNSSPGLPVTENIALSGTTEQLSTNTYSKVWAVWADSTSVSNIITVKQGSGGTARGTIGTSKLSCWLWVEALTKGAGIYLPNLDPGQNYGLWRKLTVVAGAGAVRPNSLTVSIEETI